VIDKKVKTDTIEAEVTNTREKEAKKKTRTKIKIEDKTSNIKRSTRKTDLNLMKKIQKTSIRPSTNQNIDLTVRFKIIIKCNKFRII
jgi:hypothetical protein